MNHAAHSRSDSCHRRDRHCHCPSLFSRQHREARRRNEARVSPMPHRDKWMVNGQPPPHDPHQRSKHFSPLKQINIRMPAIWALHGIWIRRRNGHCLRGRSFCRRHHLVSAPTLQGYAWKHPRENSLWKVRSSNRLDRAERLLFCAHQWRRGRLEMEKFLWAQATCR